MGGWGYFFGPILLAIGSFLKKGLSTAHAQSVLKIETFVRHAHSGHVLVSFLSLNNEVDIK
jgi:hypothetical protein